MINQIDVGQILQVWLDARVELCRAFEHSAVQSADDFLPALLAEEAQLWEIDSRAWGITRIINTKAGRTLEFVAVAGCDLDGWLQEYTEVVEDWARSLGCATSVIGGRRGWERKLKDYKVAAVTYVKEL